MPWWGTQSQQWACVWVADQVVRQSGRLRYVTTFRSVRDGTKCIYSNRIGACQSLVMSYPCRSVLLMTTTTEHHRTVILAELRRATTCITAEHHPDEIHMGTMRYSLRIQGGKHAKTVINCATEDSVIRLFNEVVALHNAGISHPFIVAV